MVVSIKITGLKKLSMKFNRLQKDIPKAVDKGIRETLKEGRRIAKSMAPIKSGDLRSGIKFRTFKGGGELISEVKSGFPYNLWVNRSQGYRTIRGRFPFFGSKGRRVLYGGSAHAPSGKSIKWTGTPGYFDKTVRILEKKYPKIMEKMIKKSIKKSFK